MFLNNYREEPLGKNSSVFVSKEHTFGTDSFLLADFAAPKAKDRAVDLGTGCGIIPLLWARGNSPASCIGIDIQAQAIEQFEQSIVFSHASTKISALLGDLRLLSSLLPAGSADLVTCNPPYSLVGSGTESPSNSRLIARHEVQANCDDICRAAAWLLPTGGRFCLCQLPERLVDVLSSMRNHHIEPKRIRFVHQQAHQAPWLFLIEGKRNAKPSISVEAPLVLWEGSETSTELKRIYDQEKGGQR